MARWTAIISLFLISACRTGGDQGELKFAYSPAEESYRGIAGRLEILRRKITANFAVLDICVGRGAGDYTDNEFLLETKLVYAAWVHGSDRFSEEDWKFFKFVQKAECSPDDESVSGAVALGVPPPAVLAYDLGEATADCQKKNGRATCSGNAVALGYGGAGSMGYSYYATKPDQWTAFKKGLPANTILNPHVAWHWISAELKESTKISSDDKDKMMKAYAGLIDQPDVSYQDLVTFVQLLSEHKVFDEVNNGLKPILEKFLASGKSQDRIIFQLKRSAMPVLLHELGHQFGMDHADNPNPKSVTGGFEIGQDLQGNIVQSFSTDQSVMAYGLPYMYLTQDDLQGIKNLSRQVGEVLAVHHHP